MRRIFTFLTRINRKHSYFVLRRCWMKLLMFSLELLFYTERSFFVISGKEQDRRFYEFEVLKVFTYAVSFVELVRRITRNFLELRRKSLFSVLEIYVKANTKI